MVSPRETHPPHPLPRPGPSARHLSVAKSSDNDGPKGLHLGLLFRRGLLPRRFTFFFLSLRLPGGLWNILVRNFTIDVRLDDLLLVFRLQVLETVQLRRLFKGFLEVGDDLGRDAAPMAPSTFFFPKKESVAKKKGYCRRKGRTSSFFLGSRRYFRISKHLLQLYSLQNKTRSLTRKQESNIHTRTRFGPCGQGCQNFFFFFSHKEWNRAIQLTFAFCARCGGVFKAVARHLLFFLGV